LVVRGLTKRYGELLALDRVDFSVERGRVIGFLGPNGAGKTTTMRAIMRLVSLDSGAITWDGEPVDREMCRTFGYMPAERGMYQRMKVREHLLYYAGLSGWSRTDAERSADRWLERLGLSDRADDTVDSLSSGNQQRVQLALALIDEPQLLVLDEPFAGLDPVATDTLAEVLLELVDSGVAMLLSSHQLDLVADVCSAVVIVDRGRVVLRGEVAELRASSPLRHFDVEFATPTAWRPDTRVTAGNGERGHTGNGGNGGSSDGRRYRVTVPADYDVAPLIADAHAAGDVVAFAFAPPDLSEVFRGSVAGSS